jgi:tetratricopeptide (TPR) repeat protein
MFARDRRSNWLPVLGGRGAARRWAASHRIVLRGCAVEAALLVLLLLIVAGVLWLLLGRRGSGNPFPTAAEVAALQRRFAADPDDPDRAFELAQAYLSQARTYRTFSRAVAGTRWMVDEMVGREQASPELRAKQQTVEAQWQHLRDQLGIRSNDERADVLQRAAHLVDRLQQRGDLPPQRVAAVHLLAAGVHLEQEEYPQAHAQIDAAARLDAQSVAWHLLRADVFTAQEQYADAIQELRAANLKITGWAHSPPDWQVRLLAGLGGAAHGARFERRWYQRRGEIASQLRHVIQTEISLLRDLQRIGELKRREASAP